MRQPVVGPDERLLKGVIRNISRPEEPDRVSGEAITVSPDQDSEAINVPSQDRPNNLGVAGPMVSCNCDGILTIVGPPPQVAPQR